MARQIIKNMGQFAKALESKVVATLELVADDVKKEVDKAIDEYYDEYDPTPYSEGRLAFKQYWYRRTYQLRDCCKISKPKIVGNTVSIEVYLDIDSLQYEQRGADPYKTVVAANSGLHGGWDVSVMEQVPWSVISGNDGSSQGNGTQIWEEPMRELIDGGKLIALFKKHAKARGLNLK